MAQRIYSSRFHQYYQNSNVGTLKDLPSLKHDHTVYGYVISYLRAWSPVVGIPLSVHDLRRCIAESFGINYSVRRIQEAVKTLYDIRLLTRVRLNGEYRYSLG